MIQKKVLSDEVAYRKIQELVEMGDDYFLK